MLLPHLRDSEVGDPRIGVSAPQCYEVTWSFCPSILLALVRGCSLVLTLGMFSLRTGRKEAVRKGGSPTFLCLGWKSFLDVHPKTSFYIPWPAITIRKDGKVNGKSLACLGPVYAGLCAVVKEVNKTNVISLSLGAQSLQQLFSTLWSPDRWTHPDQ